MSKIILRSYQEECINRMKYKYTNFPGSYLIKLPTGMGKTVIFSEFINYIKGKMLIISHRKELVYQPKKYFNCSYAIEMNKTTYQDEKVLSTTVQTINRRLGKFKRNEFDVIIVDEAHHSPAKTYRKILDYFTPRCVFGFTATPNRGDRIGLNNVYEDIIYSKDLRFGIDNNFLTNVTCKKVDIGYDLRGLKSYNGDFRQKQLDEIVNVSMANDAIAEAYFKIAKGQTVIFGCSIAHCIEIQKRIPNSYIISSLTNKKDRDIILKDFADKKFDCLINCMILTEGTDIPCIETIIMARPTKNESLYQQCVGRGLRLHPGKDKLLLIDCVGVSDLNICSAPTLLGLNTDNLLNKDMSLIEGDLFEIEDKIQQLSNNPHSWIKNIQVVSIWAKKNKYNTHGVNYIRMPNGDLVFNIPKTKNSMTISKPDEFGNSIYTINNQNFAAPVQKIFDMVYNTLCKKYSSDKNIWDISSIKRWKNSDATNKQKMWINKKLEGFNTDNLSKFDAASILNRIFAMS